MRIIAGTLGGRKLETPAGSDIRPTSDKLRGAIFNALNARIDFEDLVVLDIFCGTGALGLEAISRGAGQATFIDSARDSLELAKKNVGNLKASSQAQFVLKDVLKLGERPSSQTPADLFFCDPPYNKGLITPAVQSLVDGGWLGPEAFGVLEMEKSAVFQTPQGSEVLQEKIYGDTKVVYLQFQPKP